MFDLLLAPEGLVFTAALLLMTLIGVLEAIGLGSSALDIDLGVDADGVLSWLGFGRVPLFVLLVTFLSLFGIIGLAGQQIVTAIAGAPLPAIAAVPAAAVATLPLSGVASRVLARILPRDETTAFPLDALVGLTGTIVLGRATPGSPARARVLDPHGQAHHILVEPDGDTAFAERDQVLLVRRHGTVFRAILQDSPRYSEWIEE